MPCSAPFDAGGWLFSIDWDGSRALLFSSDVGTVRLQGERLDDITGRFPEISSAPAPLGGHTAVLDGIVTILDPEGRPDLPALARRLAGEDHGAPIAVFLATDVVHLDGAPTIDWPLEQRLTALAGLLSPDAHIQRPEPVAVEGRAFARAAGERGLGAVLARRAAAPYRPGVASPDRLRIELAPRTDCVVAGVAARSPGWGEHLLVLAEHSGGTLATSAVVSAALDRAEMAWLDAVEEDPSGPHPGLGGEPAAVRWLRPHLVATVRHRGRRRDGTLVHPELVAIRDDIDPLWCRRRLPVEPPGYDRAVSRFRPTVLVTLPIPL